MFYERHVSSFSALVKELEVLDSDSGVRVLGRYGKVRCYAFVTRLGDRFMVMIYETKGGAPGRCLVSREVESGELERLLREVTRGGVDAYVY